MSEAELQQRLCSESVLLIRREDVLQRLTPDCCLSGFSDPRWEALDVEGEEVNDVINSVAFFYFWFIINSCLNFILSGQVRQMRLEEEEDQHKLTHITIPAAYSSGVTLFALRESALGRELLDAPELPLLWVKRHWRTSEIVQHWMIFIPRVWPLL